MWLKGLMNAADYYGLDELKYACNGFIQVNIAFIIILKPVFFNKKYAVSIQLLKNWAQYISY